MPRFPLASSSLSALAGSTILLAACGGGGDGSTGSASVASTDASATTVKRLSSGTITLQQRINAANAVVKNNATCNTLDPFYWEVGDKSATQASGTGGKKSVAPPTANTSMQIASASKWLFATYAVEYRQGALSTSDIKLLNFTSGYTNMNTCSLQATESSCLSEPGLNGGTNGDYIASNDGRFVYNGGHMQVLADHIGLGPLNGAPLANQVQKILGTNVPLNYSLPLMSGGIKATPASYSQFLRNMLGGRYPHMLAMLGSDAVCTYTTAANCLTPATTPPKVAKAAASGSGDAGEAGWHYSLGHWVEDEPVTGDGAFSSPGKGGFYPWIDSTKTYYGVLTSIDSTTTTKNSVSPPGQDTNACGHLIRQAWVNPQAPV